jgi:hypothetical protein
MATLAHSQQVRDMLSRHLQGRAVGMAALQCVGMHCRQLRVPAGRQFSGFDQDGLQPRIALFGNGTTLLFAGRRAEGCG